MGSCTLAPTARAISVLRIRLHASPRPCIHALNSRSRAPCLKTMLKIQTLLSLTTSWASESAVEDTMQPL